MLNIIQNHDEDGRFQNFGFTVIFGANKILYQSSQLHINVTYLYQIYKYVLHMWRLYIKFGNVEYLPKSRWGGSQSKFLFHCDFWKSKFYIDIRSYIYMLHIHITYAYISIYIYIYDQYMHTYIYVYIYIYRVRICICIEYICM